jgi:hypothetical protein
MMLEAVDKDCLTNQITSQLGLSDSLGKWYWRGGG